MNISKIQNLLGNYESEEQAVFALLQKVKYLQEEHEIYLRGSLAYYGILGFCGRCCHDIDLAVFNPVEAANNLGLSVDTQGVDCIEGHIGYTLCGIPNRLSVELLRYPQDTPTVAAFFPPSVLGVGLHINPDNINAGPCLIVCIPLEQIVTEKLYSMAYALRETPINEYPVYKNLFDFVQAYLHHSIQKCFPALSILSENIETNLYIERNRESRFMSAEQMLIALSKIKDIPIQSSKFLDYQLRSIQSASKAEFEYALEKVLLLLSVYISDNSF